MEAQTLQAEVRGTRGKGPARQLRKGGQLPAVLYGKGVENTALSVSPKAFIGALKSEYGHNAVIELHLTGGESGETRVQTMVKDIQVHPVTRSPLHVDFYAVSEDQLVTVSVPFRTYGRALGVQKGGKLQVVFRELPVRCRPADIPSVIEVDVAPLDMGAVFTVDQLDLPQGVTVQLDPTRRLILLGEDRRKVEEDNEDGTAKAEGAEGAEKAEG